jgi:hypothetical protein
MRFVWTGLSRTTSLIWSSSFFSSNVMVFHAESRDVITVLTISSPGMLCSTCRTNVLPLPGPSTTPKVFISPRIWLYSVVRMENESAAGRQQQSNPMTFYALDFHFSIPSATDDLSQTVGIALVCLVQLHHQRSFGMPCMDANYRQTRGPKRVPVPDTQRAGLECNPHCVRSALPNDFFDLIRDRWALSLPHAIALSVDHTNRCFFQGDIQSYVLIQCSSRL